MPLIGYFEGNSNGHLHRNKKRRKPNFQINIWNYYYLLSADLPRTNNSVESAQLFFCNVKLHIAPNNMEVHKCVAKIGASK
jgi:hypothetical protein